MTNRCFKCLLEIDGKTNSVYGLHPDCFEAWFKVSQDTEFTGLVRRTSSNKVNQDAGTWNASFFHGKYKKYSANLAGESFIFKVKEDEVPELPDVEYICNQIGRILKIPVPEFYLIEFLGNRTFVTKNFIRPSAPTTLNHIYHYMGKDDFCCEKIIEVIERETKRPFYVDIFIKTCLFDSLIGNHDRHGRNLGFIASSKGTVLAPIYDNISSLGLESGKILEADFEPRGKIFTKGSAEPTTKDYVREFIRLGYGESVTGFTTVANRLRVLAPVKEGFCSGLMKKALESLLNKRFRELDDELKIA